jgi:DNA-binding MarR family transcriptional regulator
MVNVEWEENRIISTPLSLYFEYLFLRHNYFIREKLQDFDITQGEFTYLANIFYNDAMSQRDLADLLFVSEANVAKMVKKLENKGLIKRVRDEDNKSKNLIYLTEKGKADTFYLLNLTFSWETKLMESYSIEDIKKFKEILFDLAKVSVDLNE